MTNEFRVYDKRQKKYVTDEQEWLINSQGKLFYLEYDLIGDSDCIVERGSGLTDKNGTKIFEGDILKARNNDYHYTVSYEKCRFKIEDKWGNQIKMTQDAIDWLEVEITGNIHDNPEFLGERK